MTEQQQIVHNILLWFCVCVSMISVVISHLSFLVLFILILSLLLLSLARNLLVLFTLSKTLLMVLLIFSIF